MQLLSSTKGSFALKGVFVPIFLTCVLCFSIFNNGFSQEIVRDQIHYVSIEETLSIESIIKTETPDAITIDLLTIENGFVRAWLYHALHSKKALSISSEPRANLLITAANPGQNIPEIKSIIQYCLAEALDLDGKYDKEVKGSLEASVEDIHGEGTLNYIFGGSMRGTLSVTCETSLPFCTGTNYSFPAGVDNGVGQTGPNYGCLTSRKNPVWYHLKILDPGNITIKIEGIPLTGDKLDVDFALWGPFSDPVIPCASQLTAACSSCPNNTSSSSSYPYGNLHDCSYDANAIEYAHITNGQTGQYFIMVITNYTNKAGTISFQKTAGNGTTDCSILPPPASNNSPVCVGQTINLTAASVTGATYNWTGPAGFTSNQQNPQINNAQPVNSGIYSLTITVGSQTSEPTTTEVVVESMLPQGILPQGATSLCMDAPNTTYTTNSIAGAASYQWSLSPSAAGTISGNGTSTTVNWSATFVGPAFIGVGAVNSCGSGPVSSLLEVTIMGPPPETGKPTGPNSICQGSQPTQYTTSGSANAISYEWMLTPAGAGNISGNGQQTITVNWAGGFSGIAYLKVRAVNSCGTSTWSPTLDILVSELPGACSIPTGPVIFCQSGGSGNYSTPTVASASSYQWTITPANAGTVVGSTPSVTVNWSSTYTGTPQLKVTAVNDCGQGQVSPPLNINILPNPQPFAGNDTTVFTGSVIVLKGRISGSTTGYQFHWEPAAFLVNPNVMRPTTIALTQSKVFTMTVTKTGTDCQYQDEVFVEVQGSPLTASASATPAQICAGASSLLHAQGYGGISGNYTYSWFKNGVLFSNLQSPQVTPDLTTTYTVDVSDGTSIYTGTVTVTVRPLPVANAGMDKQINFNTSTTLSGSATPSGMFTWNWQPANKLANATIQNPVTVPLIQNTTFSLSVVDGNGCISLPDEVHITVVGGEMTAASSATPTAVCKGASSVLSVQVSGGNASSYQFSWYQNGALLGQNQTITVTPVETTTYQVEVSDGFSLVTSSVTVQVWPLPVANAGDDNTIPNGTSTQLNGSAASGDGNYGFYWQPADKVDNPEIADPTTALLNASVIYTLMVTDGNGCQDDDQVTVTVTGGALFASITASPPEICLGKSSFLTALVSGGSDDYTYTWTSLPAGFHSPLKDVTVYPVVSTVYILKIFDGYKTITAQAPIIVNPLPVVNAGEDQTINNGMTAMLKATATSGAPQYGFYWSPDDLVLAPSMPVTFTQNLFASQSFTVVVTDSKGCISDDQVQISIVGGPLQVNPVADDPVICCKDSTILRANAGGGDTNNNATFMWTKANSTDIFSTERNPIVKPEGTATYTVKVFDGYLYVTGSVTVKVNPLPEINLIPDDPRIVLINPLEIGACVYDTIMLNAGNPGMDYYWTNGSTNQEIMVNTSGLSFDTRISEVTVTNLITGCESTASLTVHFTFQNCSYGVDEPSTSPKLLVYPNPSRDGVFKVKLDDGISWEQLEIYSMLGNRMYAKPFTGQKEGGNEFDLNLGHLPKGFYMLRLLCKHGVFNQAIVISN